MWTRLCSCQQKAQEASPMLIRFRMEVRGAGMCSNFSIPLVNQYSFMQDVFYLIWPCSIKRDSNTALLIFHKPKEVFHGHVMCNAADAVKLDMLPRY